MFMFLVSHANTSILNVYHKGWNNKVDEVHMALCNSNIFGALSSSYSRLVCFFQVFCKRLRMVLALDKSLSKVVLKMML